MTAALATVLSALRGSRCALDVNKSYATYEAGANVPMDSTLSGVNVAGPSTDARRPVNNSSVPAEDVRPHSSNRQRVILECRQRTTHELQKVDPILSRRQNENTRFVSTRALYEDIEGLEKRCGRYERDLQQILSETVRRKLESAESCESSDNQDVDMSGVSFEPDSSTAASTKQKKRRLVRSVDSSMDPLLPNISGKRKGRRRQALDLNINGTAKLKFHHDKGKVARPKLARLQGGRWRRVGKR
jgi:hypothetical protein